VRAKYAVTFESDTKPPVTVRGEVEATSLPKLAWRAIKDARENAPKIGWSSLCIILDRDKSTLEVEEETETEVPT
jgi:hypothetical protein